MRTPRRKRSTVVGTAGPGKAVIPGGVTRYTEPDGSQVTQGPGMYTTTGPVTPGPPIDPALEATKAAANLNIGLGDAADTYQTGKIGLEYGNLDDPTSDLAANPYSRAALLQKSYQDAQRQGRTSYAASGQQYAGSYQNRVEADREGYEQNLDALRKGKQSELDQILQGKLSRYSTVGASVNQDTLNAILRALGAA